MADGACYARKDEQSTDSIDDGMSHRNKIENASPTASHSRDVPAHLLKLYGVDEYMRSAAVAASKYLKKRYAFTSPKIVIFRDRRRTSAAAGLRHQA